MSKNLKRNSIRAVFVAMARTVLLLAGLIVLSFMFFVGKVYGNMFEDTGFTNSGLDYSAPGFDDISFSVITESEFNAIDSREPDGTSYENDSEDESGSVPDESDEPSAPSTGETSKNNSAASKEESRVTSKEESKTVSKDESKTVSKEESKTVSKEESKAVSKEESKAVSKEESKTVSKEESMTVSKEESKVTSKEESKAVSKEESKAVSKEESKAVSEYVYTEPKAGVSIKTVSQIDKNVINILLIGRDSRDSVSTFGRSDAMIVVSYNSKTGKVNILSIDRDLLVPIEGHSWSKINNAYYWGGAGLLINTINSVFGLDIRYYITTDFQSFKDIIDKMGGLDVKINETEYKRYLRYGWQNILPDLHVGTNHLNGELVWRYTSDRTDSVAERSRRQRVIVQLVMEKFLKNSTLSEMLALTEYSTSKVKTNLSLSKLISYAGKVASGGMAFGSSKAIPFDGEWEYVRYNNVAAKKCDFTETKKLIRAFLY